VKSELRRAAASLSEIPTSWLQTSGKKGPLLACCPATTDSLYGTFTNPSCPLYVFGVMLSKESYTGSRASQMSASRTSRLTQSPFHAGCDARRHFVAARYSTPSHDFRQKKENTSVCGWSRSGTCGSRASELLCISIALQSCDGRFDRPTGCCADSAAIRTLGSYWFIGGSHRMLGLFLEKRGERGEIDRKQLL
jgi:hypothetical protein